MGNGTRKNAGGSFSGGGNVVNAVSTNTIQHYACGNDDIVPTHTYTICNGFSNQLIGHAAYIAHLIKLGRKVAIPDAFIVNGVQSEKNKGGTTLKNVIPTRNNSISLTSVIEADALLHMIRRLGGEACFIHHKLAVMKDKEQNKETKCSWLEQLRLSDNELVLRLLESMKPSHPLQGIVESVITNLQRKSPSTSLSDGVCLHHRDGPDWHTHCSTWKGNNCMNAENMAIEDLVKFRLPEAYPKKWMYYVGDAVPSPMLVESVKRKADLYLFHRDKDDLASNDEIIKLVGDEMPSNEKHRDIYAAVDFFVCKSLPSFIGNSVSTFSAFQTMLRRGTNSSWYNSRSIPLLSHFLQVEVFPFVYTYSERSQKMGKILLKTSIKSVRRGFGKDIEINVLYHGTKDKPFLEWLAKQRVVVHNHEPKWLGIIQDMLSYVNHKKSHLYAHIGDYIGTWQRIDIPSFIDAEYIIFLDSDTVVHNKFDLADIGDGITPGIAFSAENEFFLAPMNAGVGIMNVPKLRETYAEFLSFIQEHAEKQKDFVLGPSDQGAYLDFYGSHQTGVVRYGPSKYVKYLDITFNVKPYYKNEVTIRNRKIIHFHGMKPHDIIKAFMGYNLTAFPPALQIGIIPTMFDDDDHHLLCLMLRDFATSVIDEEDIMNQFCSVGFPSKAKEQIACKVFLQKLSEAEKEKFFACEDLMATMGYHKDSSLTNSGWKDLYWESLTNRAQKAAKLLGFNEKLWDGDDNVPIYSTPFDQLTDDKKEAVVYLGLRSYFTQIIPAS